MNDDLSELARLARQIGRGCECRYDYRCFNCEAVLKLRAWLAEYDQREEVRRVHD